MSRLLRQAALAVIIATPALVALTALRPVDAAPPAPYAGYGLTGTAAALRSGGLVGASGGLVTLDAGVGYVTGHLDSGPSAGILADPAEPGSLARTIVGQVNGTTGKKTLTVPAAEASYPGTATSTLRPVPSQAAGPLTVTPAGASASASATAAEGEADSTTTAIAGAAGADGVRARLVFSGSAALGTARAEGQARVDHLLAGGVLDLAGVAGTATLTATGGRTQATATMTYSAASVAGIPVTIDEGGVHAAGSTPLPAGPAGSAQDQVNAALAAAGVSAHAVGVIHQVSGRSGLADSGGIAITVTTPGLPVGGVAGNALTITVGRVLLTSSTTALAPPVVLPTFPTSTGGSPVTVTTTTAGQLGSPTTPSSLVPSPTLSQRSASVQVFGHTLPLTAALAGFAAWQLISLSTATLYALAERRRRLADAGSRP